MSVEPIKAFSVADEASSDDHVALSYEARLIRRKRLTSAAGRDFIVDLPQTISVSEGQAFALEDGTFIAVKAAPEEVLKITGDLVRLAWHIGNRHTPCQIAEDYLVIGHDHVLADMLKGLGAGVSPMVAPFNPEGGAYGHGRTFAHEH